MAIDFAWHTFQVESVWPGWVETDVTAPVRQEDDPVATLLWSYPAKPLAPREPGRPMSPRHQPLCVGVI